MAKTISIVLPILFLVMSIFVDQNMVRAKTCSEGLGSCKVAGRDCNAKCKDRRGQSAVGSCDNSVGPGLCTCLYQCGPPTKPPVNNRRCDGGAGLCSAACGPACCSQKCAGKYRGGTGFCNRVGNANFCNCSYPC